MGELAAKAGVPMMQVIADVRNYPELMRVAAPLEKFYEMYRELCDLSVTLPLDEFAGEVIKKTGYEAMLKAQKEEGKPAWRTWDSWSARQDLRRPERNGCHVVRLFEEVALISDLDSYDQDADSVTMMTIHSAKGLEFPYVFVVGMEDGIFPATWRVYTRKIWRKKRALLCGHHPRQKGTLSFHVPQPVDLWSDPT